MAIMLLDTEKLNQAFKTFFEHGRATADLDIKWVGGVTDWSIYAPGTPPLDTTVSIGKARKL